MAVKVFLNYVKAQGIYDIDDLMASIDEVFEHFLQQEFFEDKITEVNNPKKRKAE